jgi:pimeloyl-ACP methyl ester carboxylesterase/predicted glycosyltransferase
VERGGVRVSYEVYGRGDPTVLLLPCFQIVQSRVWKAQVPDLARRWRTITFDARGTGGSDRPVEVEAYSDDEVVGDAIAVLDACEVDAAIAVGFSKGCWWGALLAAEYPERVHGLVAIGASSLFDIRMPLVEDAMAQGITIPSWDVDYEGFLEFFFANVFSEPHSTKQIEDSVGWGLETTPAVLAASSSFWPVERAGAVYRAVSCPVLVVQGTDDRIASYESGQRFARDLDAALVSLDGSGHNPAARDPVKVNLLLREFVRAVGGESVPARQWVRARGRQRRALFVSSPIGLGHAMRDVAIARELRARVPDLEIDWLAQDPVTRFLEAEGEAIHPASAFLVSESEHIESESAEHDLHCFQAWRRMDEIMIANFMMFHDVVAEQTYDVWIGDEAWEVDYFLHENPELKRAAYCWLTDFVGWLPMPSGGAHERELTADYNAEMLEHIARYPRLRDQAIFIGETGDLVNETFGPGLPTIPEWAPDHFAFPGYVSGFDPIGDETRRHLRDEFGYREDDRVCVVAVGGSNVGRSLLRKVIDAQPLMREAIPGLHTVVIAGPRIDPASLPRSESVEIHAFVPRLYRHLAACDLAIVQGGLTTTMELTANGRPFLYFPLRHHFEQQFHVRHRLDRYHAGRYMDYHHTTPEQLAAAAAEVITTPVRYQPVGNQASAAATLIADLF